MVTEKSLPHRQAVLLAGLLLFCLPGLAQSHMIVHHNIHHDVSAPLRFRALHRTCSQRPCRPMEAEVSVVTGTVPQITGRNRWGDYSAMQIDPADDCTFLVHAGGKRRPEIKVTSRRNSA
jgi:hypothetical protein